MSKQSKYERYITLFPEEFRFGLTKKLDYKNTLEKERSLKIPPRIWLAFLTPPDPKAGALPQSRFKKVWELKKEMLDTFKHPKRFLDVRDPLHHASDCVTLAVLETLYDLEEQKILLPSQRRYREWLNIAEHFGLWRLRYALEDAVFKTFDPNNFSLFKSVVEKQLFIDQHLILGIRSIIESALKQAGLKKFSIENRGKNIYGVYKKVALKQKSVNEIFDIHGFRILTSSPEECYKAVEVLHRLWRSFPERYKDYIKEPKENGYRSIHTVLSCLEGKLVEFQVRTIEMDIVAESGPANHADYRRSKESATLMNGNGLF